MAIGQDEIVNQTIKLIDSVSEAVNGNGQNYPRNVDQWRGLQPRKH